VGDTFIFINNAGIAIAKNVLEEKLHHRRLQFEINVLAPMRLVQEFLPTMAQQNHGHVVTVASASSFISTAQTVTYADTKAAVMAFHEGAAQELRMRYNARRVRIT
jgi:short-subunit dehydrogenase